ncbi:MAG: hypothetical protein KDB69_08090 [Acidimicrobiia bacterium]|nr:hypothetical protein [Acidimicrobiia bacterium]
MTRRLLLALLIVFALSACGLGPGGTTTTGAGGETTTTAEAGGETTTTAAPDTTTTTAASEETTTTGAEATTTVAGEEGEGVSPGVIALALGLLAVIIFAAWAIGRGRRTATPAAPAAPAAPTAQAWQTDLRSGLADAHWLATAMTDDVAVQRGEVTARASGATTGIDQRWLELDSRMQACFEAWYRVEASAPDPQVTTTVRRGVDQVRATRTALDDRAAARASAISRPDDAAAIETERLAASRLAQARVDLDTVLRDIDRLA